MTAALAIAAKAPCAPTVTPSAPVSLDATGFARVDVFASLAEARRDWAELAALACASPYQSFGFAEAWFETLGVERRAAPCIVVARGTSGAPLALLPLARFRRAGLGVAEFLGGKHSNYNLGLFRPGRVWSKETLEDLFAEAARAAKARVDLFALFNQPRDWEGCKNPLAALAGQPSPSFGYKSSLPLSFAAWRDAHNSKAARKKLRKGAERLSSIGALEHVVARDQAEAARLLDAAIAQKRARASGGGPASAYESAAAQAFLRRLASDAAGGAKAAMEMHALTAGDRVVATMGALPGRERLSGLLVAFDPDPEIARCSPGRLLVQEVVGSAIERGFAEFDLGVGESRYKSECCEGVDMLFDSFIVASALGRAAALGFSLGRRLKGRVKRSPRLMPAMGRLRGLRR